jgi:hypothetical protein
MTTSIAARVAALERRTRRKSLRAAVERLLAEDTELAATSVGDVEDIVAEAERMLARGDPDLLAALAQARCAERSAGEG